MTQGVGITISADGFTVSFELPARAALDLILQYGIPGATITPPTDVLKTILTNTERLIEMSTSTTNSLANLQAAVANETTVDQSVLTLLTTLAQELAAASPTGDNPAIDAVVATMTANAASLSAAVAANTPGAGSTGATGATGP
jgi:hypothetical protein